MTGLSTDDLRDALRSISRWGDSGEAPPLPRLEVARLRTPRAEPSHRSLQRVLGVAAAILIVVAAAGLLVRSGGTADVAAARGTWDVIAPGPLSPRYGASTLWTGAEVLIVGGIDGGGTSLVDGARYDPQLDEWRPMRPVPSGGHVDLATWTGGEAVYLVRPEGRFSTDYDIVAYDAAADAWRTILEARFEPDAATDALQALRPVPIEAPEVLATVGDQLVIFGWQSSQNQYGWTTLDAENGTWAEPHLISGTAAMHPMEGVVAAADGRLFLANERALGTEGTWGLVIDVAAGHGQRIEPPPVEAGDATGRGFYALHAGVSGGDVVVVGLRLTRDGAENRREAWRLDAATGTWVAVEPPPDGPTADQDGAVSLVSTELGLVMLGGLDLGAGVTNGGLETRGAVHLASDSAVERWAELPEPPIDLHRVEAAAVWTGSEIIVWGGTGTEPLAPGGPVFGDGARFRVG